MVYVVYFQRGFVENYLNIQYYYTRIWICWCQNTGWA